MKAGVWEDEQVIVVVAVKNRANCQHESRTFKPSTYEPMAKRSRPVLLIHTVRGNWTSTTRYRRVLSSGVHRETAPEEFDQTR